MSGGVGSRFWPFSKEGKPKQFLDFFGTGRSLLQSTFDRFKEIVPVENIYIVTKDAYAEMTSRQLPELKDEQSRWNLSGGTPPGHRLRPVSY